MYIVYRRPNPEEANIVGVCFTRRGAAKAARHFYNEYSRRHPARFCEVGIEEIMPYALVRLATFVFKI